MLRIYAIFLVLFFTPILGSAEDLDVRGGFFEEDDKVATPARESRFEEIRKNRVDRNPRRHKERKIVDIALDVAIKGPSSNDIKHGLDAATNIHEAIKIRENRLNGGPPEDETYYEEKYK